MRFGVLLAATAISVLAAPALAADLGAPEPLPAPPVVQAAPENNWTGFYLGALLGYNWGTSDTDAVGDIDTDGIEGGAYVGANYQWGNFVVGAEGDLLYSGANGDDGGIDVDQGLNGSMRARAGIALDRFLVYGTGGAAVTSLELDDGISDDQQTLWGWTLGAGTEAMVWRNVTARVEYRYTDYQDKTFDLGGGSTDSDLSTHSVRAGVGVKF
jgi:outer membrane immunogenic protein